MSAVWDFADFDDHEHVHMFRDRASGLTAVIAVHSTHLGPGAAGDSGDGDVVRADDLARSGRGAGGHQFVAAGQNGHARAAGDGQPRHVHGCDQRKVARGQRALRIEFGSFMEIIAHCLTHKGCLVSDLHKHTVTEIMSAPPITAGPEMTMDVISSLFLEVQINRLPIVDAEERPIGIVTRTNLVRSYSSLRGGKS